MAAEIEEVGKEGWSFNVHPASGTVLAILAPDQMTWKGVCTSVSVERPGSWQELLARCTSLGEGTFTLLLYSYA